MGNCFEGFRRGKALAGLPAPATPKQGFKVCVCGGAGGIGQPLCLLMALDPRVWELSVYDLTIAMVPAEGIGTDLGHIERKCRVKAYSLDTTQKPVDHLRECLQGCSLVLVPVGVPSKGRSKSDLLKINANIAKSIVEACAAYCPDAIVGLIVNPLNSVVPAMARLYEKAGLDPRKVIGITSLDTVRANKFVHEATQIPIEHVQVPVVGGYSGSMSGPSAVPLFSQDAGARSMGDARCAELMKRVQDAGNEVVDAKKGKGSSTLSMAYAAARFGRAVLTGLSGERCTEIALLKTDAYPGVDYFSTKVVFGPKGVEEVLPPGAVSPKEKAHLDLAVKTLQEDIKEGLAYAEHVDLAKRPEPKR
ncbi:unnamed protein product [Effrenium voratum]|uniref:malate dehydrogenase n=1 Tax=Effrenium voratum TaxID=2562239 RepID=A0AA36IKX2_9DINO|nr:unnamed protein product [Effrenium voratum]CAJ1445281.1 unnamed protein product [Effrenium voratum]